MIACSPGIYMYNNVTFQYGRSIGIWPLKRNGDPRKLCGRQFLSKVKKFLSLSNSEKNSYKINGGCQVI